MTTNNLCSRASWNKCMKVYWKKTKNKKISLCFQNRESKTHSNRPPSNHNPVLRLSIEIKGGTRKAHLIANCNSQVKLLFSFLINFSTQYSTLFFFFIRLISTLWPANFSTLWLHSLDSKYILLAPTKDSSWKVLTVSCSSQEDLRNF